MVGVKLPMVTVKSFVDPEKNCSQFVVNEPSRVRTRILVRPSDAPEGTTMFVVKGPVTAEPVYASSTNCSVASLKEPSRLKST